jgi:hypothetical protein
MLVTALQQHNYTGLMQLGIIEKVNIKIEDDKFVFNLNYQYLLQFRYAQLSEIAGRERKVIIIARAI